MELFTRRNFVCDCGTTRLPSTSKCALRVNPETGSKGEVHSEESSATNDYNQNFRNRFCGCAELYNPHEEKGTMFQCLGLGTTEQGGCGEDWWHPECLMRLPRDWLNSQSKATTQHGQEKAERNGEVNGHADTRNGLGTIVEEAASPANGDAVQHDNGDSTGEPIEEGHPTTDTEPPLPPGFPDEDDFDHFICYKCVETFPWIKRYAGTPGFLPAVKFGLSDFDTEDTKTHSSIMPTTISNDEPASERATTPSLKRKAEDDTTAPNTTSEPSLKKPKSEDSLTNAANPVSTCKYARLPTGPTTKTSLFLHEDFRSHLCHCRHCFPHLPPHPQLLEEETVYEPPVSASNSEAGDESVGSRSLLDRGEAALSNMDRVRAIEGVMAYNKLRDNLKGFLKPFADSGRAVGAEDIKRHFEILRGDEGALRGAEGESSGGGGDGGGEKDQRREQGGY